MTNEEILNNAPDLMDSIEGKWFFSEKFHQWYVEQPIQYPGEEPSVQLCSYDVVDGTPTLVSSCADFSMRSYDDIKAIVALKARQDDALEALYEESDDSLYNATEILEGRG